ncbi:MAG TPA: transcription antitermination factor NusB [Desulfobacteria bacterium]|nr:transcription antitermination factor NusB [Desulfobacteria bacterium]
MKRRAAREAAVQALYQIDIAKTDAGETVSFVVEENNLSKAQEEFVFKLITGVINNLNGINDIIKEIALEWDIERMAAVDRNILRLALFEICYSTEVPPSVAANEAIELGKTFSTADSGRFINGILGKVLANPEQYRKVESETGV